MVQADRLGPKVGGHLAPCCIHRVNQGELSQCFKHDESTIKIVLVLLFFLLLLLLLLLLLSHTAWFYINLWSASNVFTVPSMEKFVSSVDRS